MRVSSLSLCDVYYHPTQYDVNPFEHFTTFSLQEKCLEALSDGKLGQLTCRNDMIGTMARFVAKMHHTHTFTPVLWEIDTYYIHKAKRPTVQRCINLQIMTGTTFHKAVRTLLLLANGDKVGALTILEQHDD